MAGSRANLSTMTAARLVLVKGLSNSTSQLSEAGQGTEQPWGGDTPDDGDERDGAQ
jgi:hypothetical protein